MTILTPLEERIVSRRLSFAQIRQLGYKRAQLQFTRTIINVPIDIGKVQMELPRNLDDTMTVAIMLKHKLEYKNDFLCENVCSTVVMVALNDLCKTTLYKHKGIVIDLGWQQMFNKTLELESIMLSTIQTTNKN